MHLPDKRVKRKIKYGGHTLIKQGNWLHGIVVRLQQKARQGTGTQGIFLMPKAKAKIECPAFTFGPRGKELAYLSVITRISMPNDGLTSLQCPADAEHIIYGPDTMQV